METCLKCPGVASMKQFRCDRDGGGGGGDEEDADYYLVADTSDEGIAEGVQQGLGAPRRTAGAVGADAEPDVAVGVVDGEVAEGEARDPLPHRVVHRNLPGRREDGDRGHRGPLRHLPLHPVR